MTTCIRRPHTVWTTCPCEPCRIDARRMAKVARTGRYRRVPAAAARIVIDRLTHRGWTSLAIASATNVHYRTIDRALHGATCGPTVAAMIVAHGDPTEGSVGVEGTRRRLQGLARQGYDLQTIADATGIRFSTLAAIRNGSSGDLVRSRFYTTIRDYTNDVGMKLGPSRPAIRHAERNNWPGLLAWDDIDEPNEKPQGQVITTRPKTDLDPATILRVLAGDRLRMTTAERREVVTRARGLGWSEERIYAVTGIARATDSRRYEGSAA